MTKRPNLMPRQQRFVEEFLVDLNATKAAERAGYSPRTAYSQGQLLLKNVEVQGAIHDAMEARLERTEITQDMVLRELAGIAFNDMADVATWGADGLKLKDMADLAPEVRKSVAEVSETKTVHGGTVRVKFHDKLAALTLLGKHLGMFTDRKELTVIPGADRPLREWPLEDLIRVQDHLRAVEGVYTVVPGTGNPEPEALPAPE